MLVRRSAVASDSAPNTNAGRIAFRSDDHEIVVHHFAAVDAVALLHELQLTRLVVHEQRVGVSVLAQFDGLSGADRQRNIQLLKDQAWFDIPIVYTNNGRAILAVEKGPPGDRAFADAFAAWAKQ